MPVEKRMFVATIGKYQHDRIDFALVGRSIQRIELIHSDAPESKEAAQKIREKYGLIVHTHNADPWDYLSILSLALQIVNKNPNHIPEFHIGLGTRVMTMALAMAALFTESEMFLVVESEDRSPKELIQISRLPTSSMVLQKKNILQIIKGMDNHTAQSAEVLRKALREQDSTKEISTSSISKHLKALVKLGFVSREKRGKTKAISLTKLGLTVLTMKDTRKRYWKA